MKGHQITHHSQNKKQRSIRNRNASSTFDWNKDICVLNNQISGRAATGVGRMLNRAFMPTILGLLTEQSSYSDERNNNLCFVKWAWVSQAGASFLPPSPRHRITGKAKISALKMWHGKSSYLQHCSRRPLFNRKKLKKKTKTWT